MKPHRSKNWLNPEIDDREAFAEQAQALCALYLAAPSLHGEGVHLVSTDEKTGIQALECKHPTKPTVPGLVERREFEYLRHGTLCLLANLEVATGRIVAATISRQRKEADFARHIVQTIDTDAAARWIFVVDGLNTHMSETLVKVVNQRCELGLELGIKGKSGILKSKRSRRAFLESPAHRIRFVYTPKHCSWLNQVEIWFSILVRRLLKRGSFSSLADLEHRLLAFIAYFNAVLAKPFKWTYTGRPLMA